LVVSFPAKPYTTSAGEKKYQPFFRITEKEEYDNFCAQVKAAIETHLNENVQEQIEEHAFYSFKEPQF